MELRKQIGQRITKARKELGITIKELSLRTAETLSAARISNWEQGTRSPGPLEAKLLANHLNVSASYLLCLTDNQHGDMMQGSKNNLKHLPLFTMKEIHNKKTLAQQDISILASEKIIVVDNLNPSINSSELFATIVDDNSMQPEFNAGDLLVIDAELKPNPGNYVLAHLIQKEQTVLRRYSEAEGCLFQLLPNSNLWTAISIKHAHEAQMIGVVTECRRYLR